MKKVFYIAVAVVAVMIVLYAAAMPDVARLKRVNPKKTALMEYREEQWKEKGKRRSIYQVWVPLSGVSPYLVKAAIIAEDDKFYSHEGFDYAAMEAAMEKNIKARKWKSGGSTITQQLAKNLYLSPRKSALRKIREAAITWKLEHTLSKRRILELYLNIAEWGDGIFGAEAASRRYYGKGAGELTAIEAARLVSVLPNPIKYNPAGEQNYVLKRSEIIYDIMVRRGIVVEEFDELTSPAKPSEESSARTGASGAGGAKDEKSGALSLKADGAPPVDADSNISPAPR